MSSWILLLALMFAPAQKIPGWEETDNQRRVRYESIAEDIAHTVESQGAIAGLSKADSATLLLAVSIGESGLAPDADWGPCYREGRYKLRCDSGRSVGIAQTMVRKRDRWKYFANRKLHLALAYRRIGASVVGCRSLPWKYRLAMYGSGRCTSLAGQKGSARRMALFSTLARHRWIIESQASAQAKR